MNEHRINLLKAYIEEDPTDPFNHYGLAMEYIETNPQEALEILNNLIKKFPNYLPSYYKTAHLLWEMEEWDRAEKMFLDGMKLAEIQKEYKTLNELKSSFQNFQIERD